VFKGDIIGRKSGRGRRNDGSKPESYNYAIVRLLSGSLKKREGGKRKGYEREKTEDGESLTPKKGTASIQNCDVRGKECEQVLIKQMRKENGLSLTGASGEGKIRMGEGCRGIWKKKDYHWGDLGRNKPCTRVALVPSWLRKGETLRD